MAPTPADGGDRRADDDQAPDRKASTLGLIVALVVIVIGFLLIKELSDNTKIDDCNMAGRKNCVPLDVPPRRSSLPAASAFL